MFKKVLKDSDEITDFIVKFSTDFVDEELIREYFFGCRAILKKVPVRTLKLEDPAHHTRDRKKEKFYQTLPLKTMPPLIVDDGKVVDGNHRFRVAKKKGRKWILIYETEALES